MPLVHEYKTNSLCDESEVPLLCSSFLSFVQRIWYDKCFNNWRSLLYIDFVYKLICTLREQSLLLHYPIHFAAL